MKASIYARYSSDLQQETSIEDQVSRCGEYAEQHGFKIGDGLVFSDRGISGASRHNRPSLLACIERAGIEYDTLLVWDFSRLARNVEDHGWVQNRLERAGVVAVSVSNGLELASEAGDFSAAMNARLRKMIGANTHRGQRSRYERGFATGGLPFGFVSVPVWGGSYECPSAGARPTHHEIHVNPDSAEVVRRIYREYVAGSSYRVIAEHLTSDGAQKPKARGKGHRGSREWCPTAVRSILVNPAYAGDWVWNRTRKVRDHDTGRHRHLPRPESDWCHQHRPELAIVSPELWNSAKQARERKGAAMRRGPGGLYEGKRAGGPGSGKALLAGLVECASCHSGYYSVYRGKWGCGIRHNRGATACSNDTRVPGSELEARVLDAIRSQILVPENVQYVAEQAVHRVLATAESASAGYGAVQERLAHIEEEIENLIGALARTRDGASQERIVAHLSKREREADEIKAGLGLGSASASIDETELRQWVVERVEALEESLLGAEDQGGAALRMLFAEEKLRVHPDGRIEGTAALDLGGDPGEEGAALPWCPGLDSNQHPKKSGPGPQPGVSTNFTTWAVAGGLNLPGRQTDSTPFSGRTRSQGAHPFSGRSLVPGGVSFVRRLRRERRVDHLEALEARSSLAQGLGFWKARLERRGLGHQRCLRLGSLEDVGDAAVAGHARQGKARHHEHDGGSGRELGQEVPGSPSSEDGVTTAAAKGDADVGSLAVLEQYDRDQAQACRQVQ